MGELADADVLVFSVHGCVLLVVDVDGREADHGVGEVCEASRVRACRQDERGDGGIGKDRLRRFLHVLIAAAVKGRGLVVFVVLVAQDDLHAVTAGHFAQGVEIFSKSASLMQRRNACARQVPSSSVEMFLNVQPVPSISPAAALSFGMRRMSRPEKEPEV